MIPNHLKEEIIKVGRLLKESGKIEVKKKNCILVVLCAEMSKTYCFMNKYLALILVSSKKLIL